MTRAGVDAARAGKIKLEAQRVLLDNGLALQIKNDFMRIERSRAQVGDSTKAQGYAEENRKLNVRAYQEEMVETKDVIEAQLVETFASANLIAPPRTACRPGRSRLPPRQGVRSSQTVAMAWQIPASGFPRACVAGLGRCRAEGLPPVAIGFYLPVVRDLPRKDVEVSLRFWVEELARSSI
jgi:hypothetical protein